MVSEEEIIIAFLFKRSGKRELHISDLYLSLSMELNWFSPSDAKAFVNQAIEKKLLVKKDHVVQPHFRYETINIPVGFQPSQEYAHEQDPYRPGKQLDAIKKIIQRIAKETKLDEHSIINQIEKITREKNIDRRVASLLIGKKYGIFLNDCYEEIESGIFKENKE
jgi:hypothetical protein